MSKPQTVLIVEDDPDLRRMYRLTLTFAGYEVQEAADGLEALQRLDSSSPDLIVLDLMLPSFSGHVVRQEIAAGALTRHIPVVVVTGSEGDLDHLDVPCVLRKPVSAESLVSAVQKCLAAGTPSAGA